MTPAYVTRPCIAHPPYQITTEEICEHIQRTHPTLPRLAAMLRYVRRTQVKTRRFTRPLSDPAISGDADGTERNRIAFADAAELAVRAAQEALTNANLTAADVDCVITSHTTSWTAPGLDIHLTQALGLRPDVRRMPMGSLGCAGGAHALAKAADDIAAHPGSVVLVAVAEMLSTTYHSQETTPESMIYKALFGDSGGACLVSARPLGPGLRIDSTWEFVLPNSTQRYRGRKDGEGLYFESDKSAVQAINDVMPALLTYLDEQDLTGLEFTVLHPGGPRIIEDAARGLAIDQAPQLEDQDRMTRHSWTTLREDGNLGGVGVLAVLSRTHADPPADGARGLLFGVGPGFAAAGATATWHA
ncbi:polyketide synthase [Streptomyces aureoverticillatus]|nr:polyketide synthase [Streptomyces aureoverticillatus]